MEEERYSIISGSNSWLLDTFSSGIISTFCQPFSFWLATLWNSHWVYFECCEHFIIHNRGWQDQWIHFKIPHQLHMLSDLVTLTSYLIKTWKGLINKYDLQHWCDIIESKEPLIHNEIHTGRSLSPPFNYMWI